MADIITFNQVKDAIINIADKLERNRQYYNDLDSPIGDSDHGDSICSTFRIIKKTLISYDKGTDNKDIGVLLKNMGRELLFTGGAAMGPLYGSAFMEAGKILLGKSEMHYGDLVKMWVAFADAISKRGGVKIGEKTMYDTIKPATNAIEEAYSVGKSLKESCKLTIDAAEKGMNSTKDMISIRGRSSRMGKRTIGHIDPGSASMYTIISTFFESIVRK